MCLFGASSVKRWVGVFFFCFFFFFKQKTAYEIGWCDWSSDVWSSDLSGAREEGRRLMRQFQTLRESGAATTVGQNYLEQGRYAEAVTSTGAEPELVDKRTPDVVFKDVTA